MYPTLRDRFILEPLLNSSLLIPHSAHKRDYGDPVIILGDFNYNIKKNYCNINFVAWKIWNHVLV